MLKHLEELTDLVGKTVTAVASQRDEAVIVVGDSYLLLSAESYDSDEEADLEVGGPAMWLNWTAEKLVKAGVLTAEEIQAERQKLIESQGLATERRERVEYERLKAKFEGKS